MAVIPRLLLLSSSPGMEEELSAAIARFVIEAGGLEQARAGFDAYVQKHTSTGESDWNTVTPSTSITTLSPLPFSPNNALNLEATMSGSSLWDVRPSPLVPKYPDAINPGNEVVDPWRSPGTRQRIGDTSNATMGSSIPNQRGHKVSCWGDEKQSEPPTPTIQTPPQRSSPIRDSKTSDSSAIPLSSIGSIQHLPVTPSRPLEKQRPVWTSPVQRPVSVSLGPSPVRRPMSVSLGPSPVQRPVSVSSGPSPVRRPMSVSSNLSSPGSTHPEPSIVARISSPPRNQQQSPPVSRQPNKHLGRARSKEAPGQHQAHPLSQGFTLPSARNRNTQVSHPSSSIPPILGQSSGRGGLDPRLAAIAIRNSALTRSQFHDVILKIEQDKWYLGETSNIWLKYPGIPVKVLVYSLTPTTVKSNTWYAVSRGKQIGIFHNWGLVKPYVTGLDATYKKWGTEYDAYLAYQECLLRGEVERINLPGNVESGENDEGDDSGDVSDEYFADELWPIY